MAGFYLRNTLTNQVTRNAGLEFNPRLLGKGKRARSRSFNTLLSWLFPSSNP